MLGHVQLQLLLVGDALACIFAVSKQNVSSIADTNVVCTHFPIFLHFEFLCFKPRIHAHAPFSMFECQWVYANDSDSHQWDHTTVFGQTGHGGDERFKGEAQSTVPSGKRSRVAADFQFGLVEGFHDVGSFSAGIQLSSAGISNLVCEKHVPTRPYPCAGNGDLVSNAQSFSINGPLKSDIDIGTDLVPTVGQDQ